MLPETRRRLLRGALLAVGATLAVAIDLHLAFRVARAPARCAEGMVLEGARCCGEGQHAEAGTCVGAPTRCAVGLRATPVGCAPEEPAKRIAIPGGTLTVAPGDWEATGVVRARTERVEPFQIDAFELTEARWLACVQAKACPELPALGEPGLPRTGVTATEAALACAFEGGRLPRESELAFAAAGPEGRRYPWGRSGFVCRRAAWGLGRGPCAEGATGPEIVGAHPAGATPLGVHDLAGNVAEWTSPEGDRAAVLGGAWDDVEAAALRTWSRREEPQGARSDRIGFRCVYAP